MILKSFTVATMGLWNINLINMTCYEKTNHLLKIYQNAVGAGKVALAENVIPDLNKFWSRTVVVKR